MYPNNNNNDQWGSAFDQPAPAPYPPTAGSGGAPPPPPYAPAPAPAQQPMIINVQQNAPTQQAPPSYGGAPPPPVIAKTSDQIFGTNTGAGFAVASSQRGRNQDKTGCCICFVLFFIMGIVGTIAALYTEHHDICHAPNPFTLEPGVTLILSPPVHPTCEVHNDGRTEPGCFVYDDNNNCPLIIQSTNNQISYQVRHHDFDPIYNCGDSLTVNGVQFCGYQWSGNNEVQTMEYEINVHWFSDSIPNYDYEGFNLWVWEENPNESRSIAAESTMTKALDPKVRPSKEERDEIRKANLNPPGDFIRY